MMIEEDISARGQQQSHRDAQQNDDDNDKSVIVHNTGKIKLAKDCQMYHKAKLGKKLGEGAYGSVYQALSL